MTGKVRLHESILRERIMRPRQMAFVSGPRQVGKTTACRALASKYLDWDHLDDRRLILRGPAAVAGHLGIDRARDRDAIVGFDNLNGYRKWKSFLRSFRARYGARLHLIITGNAALESGFGAKGGFAASAFLLRMHPWSVGECAHAVPTASLVQPPAAIGDEDWLALLEHGGFPEPFLKRDPRFTRRWQAKRLDRLIGTDLRELAILHDPAAVRMLAVLLAERSGTGLIYSDLSRELGVAVDTVTRWTDLLVRLQFGFRVRPWFANVAKALRRQPKWFLRDWAGVAPAQARLRTFIACHLLKAVEGWTDLGRGQFELRYVRDKLKREVDFVVVRDHKPWFLVEVGNESTLAAELGYFQGRLRARHAFHVVWDSPFVAANCFERTEPSVVSARTLLSQLL